LSQTFVKCLSGLVLLLMAVGAQAAVDIREFDSEVDRKRYLSFIDVMRCPKCEGQNLAGSDSPIARDLRQQLYELIKDGRSDKEIIDFMVERYGEYILYRPRLSPATVVLWFGPVVLMLGGIIILIVVVRKRRLESELGASGEEDLSPEARQHLDQLLRNDYSSDNAFDNPSDDENTQR